MNFDSTDDKNIAEELNQHWRIAKKQAKVLPKVDLIRRSLEETPDVFGGIYLEDERAVVLLVNNDPQAREKAEAFAGSSPNIEIRSVKYSEKELREAVETAI